MNVRADFPRVSDHALLRWLERVGGADVEAVRTALSAGLARAAGAANAIGEDSYTVVLADTVLVVREGVLVTVYPRRKKAGRS